MDHPNIKNRPRKLLSIESQLSDESEKILNGLGVKYGTVKLSDYSSTGVVQADSLFIATFNGDNSFLEKFCETIDGQVESLVCVFQEDAPSTRVIGLLKEKIYSFAELVVIDEKSVAFLTGRAIKSYTDVEKAGEELVQTGMKSLLILCDRLSDSSYDRALFCDSGGTYWLTSEKGGTALKKISTLATAIAGSMSVGLSVRDSVVLGTSLYKSSVRSADGFFKQCDLPWINGSAEDGETLFTFPTLPPAGRVYPIVDSFEWVERLVTLGVKTLQLRIKGFTGSRLEEEIKKSIEVSGKAGARLFINDFWELAIKHSAYGVHLGQDDLLTADIRAIEKAGLRLGVSTHCYFEAAVAHGLRPSYIAFGPVYHTELKAMDFAPQGIGNLKTWRRFFDYPLVAIGGITLERADEILEGEPDYISVVRDITLSKNPDEKVKSWLKVGE